MSNTPRQTNEGDVLRGKLGSGGEITPFDLLSIGNLEDEEIISIIEKRLEISFDDPQIYTKFNAIYKKVLSYMKNHLFYDKKELTRFQNKNFQNKEDIIKFLQETKTKHGTLNCVIAKLFQAFSDADEEFNENVRTVKEKTTQVIDKKLLPHFQIKKSDGDTFVGEMKFESDGSLLKVIPFTIKKRIKSTESSISKEVRDPLHFVAEKISDWYGVSVEVEKKADILPLMQMIAAYVFKKGDYEVRNDKGMFTKGEITQSTDINNDFREKIITGTIERDKPESGSICDIRLLSPVEKSEGTKNMSLEIQFIVKENENEVGVNMHGVYNYMKKITERIRLEGSINSEYIETVVNKFIEDLPNILEKNTGRKEIEGDSAQGYKFELFNDLQEKGFIGKESRINNPHIIANIDGYIRSGLIAYYKSKLTLVKKEKKNGIFYTNRRGLKISGGENPVGEPLSDQRE